MMRLPATDLAKIGKEEAVTKNRISSGARGGGGGGRGGGGGGRGGGGGGRVSIYPTMESGM